MQFDAAINNVCINYAEPYVASNKASFTPHYELIQKKFSEAGYSKAPKILFWNLNGNTKDYPAQSDTIGVEMISGFSGAVLKYFMEGNFTAKNPGQILGNTPYMTLRKQLDDERYLAVREMLNDVF
jgi:hypothetical protein